MDQSEHTPLTGKERSRLLARVYRIILAPDWDKEEEIPALPLRKRRRLKANQTTVEKHDLTAGMNG